MVQVVVVNPAGTTTDAGMEAIADPPLTIPRETEVFTATGALKVTLPVAFKPPRTGVGVTLTAVGCGGSRVRVPFAL